MDSRAESVRPDDRRNSPSPTGERVRRDSKVREGCVHVNDAQTRSSTRWPVGDAAGDRAPARRRCHPGRSPKTPIISPKYAGSQWSGKQHVSTLPSGSLSNARDRPRSEQESLGESFAATAAASRMLRTPAGGVLRAGSGRARELIGHVVQCYTEAAGRAARSHFAMILRVMHAGLRRVREVEPPSRPPGADRADAAVIPYGLKDALPGKPRRG